jgi:hypothetical protein
VIPRQVTIVSVWLGLHFLVSPLVAKDVSTFHGLLQNREAAASQNSRYVCIMKLKDRKGLNERQFALAGNLGESCEVVKNRLTFNDDAIRHFFRYSPNQELAPHERLDLVRHAEFLKFFCRQENFEPDCPR